MDTWLSFNGVADRIGESFILTASNEGGKLRIDAKDVVVENGTVKVRKGAPSELIQNPATEERPDGFELMSGDCSKWACIGLIRRCCDDGRIDGVCIGVVGC